MPPTKAASQVFRAVTVTSMDRSAALATAVNGGVLRSTILTMSGASACITTMAMSTGTTSIRGLGSLFVALGINLSSFQAHSLSNIKGISAFGSPFPYLSHILSFCSSVTSSCPISVMYSTSKYLLLSTSISIVGLE